MIIIIGVSFFLILFIHTLISKSSV